MRHFPVNESSEQFASITSKYIDKPQDDFRLYLFQKTAFENSYNAMIMMQTQTEKMAESLYNRSFEIVKQELSVEMDRSN